MSARAAAFFFRRLQFAQALAVQRQAAGDEQFGDQFVLGAEMIIHRREIDVGRGDDVAQRDVAKTAIGIEPLGGGKDRGSGVIRSPSSWRPMRSGALHFKQLYETIV